MWEKILKKIEAKRIKRGMTITEIAKKSNKSRYQYRKIVRDPKYNFTKESINDVLEASDMELVAKDKDI